MDNEELKKITDVYHQQTSRYRHQIKELREDNQRLSANVERLEQEVNRYTDTINQLRKKCKKLTAELKEKDNTISDLRSTKGTNPRNAGRKRLQDLWKEKIFECWRSDTKDKDIYGWLTCIDEKGEFHILSQATYYRIKSKYYDAGEWKKETK